MKRIKKVIDKLIKAENVGDVDLTEFTVTNFEIYRNSYNQITDMLDSFGVPSQSDEEPMHNLSLKERILILADMVRSGAINDKLATEFRLMLHHAKNDVVTRLPDDKFMRDTIGQYFKNCHTGKTYMLINYTKDTETKEIMVIYQEINGVDATVWSMPLGMFFGKAENREGKFVDRFVQINKL